MSADTNAHTMGMRVVAMATGAIVARILTQYSNKGSKAAQKDVATLSKSFDNFARNAKRAFGIAGVASAAFALKLGKDSVQAAMADQKSQVLLANTLRNTTGATDEAIAGVETYITRLQKQFSVVDDDLRPAMARLTAATGSTAAAQDLMQTALDVSASSGADLLTTTNAIIAGTRGQFRALAKLVPGLDSATLATKDYEKILNKVNIREDAVKCIANLGRCCTNKRVNTIPIDEQNASEVGKDT